MAPTINPIRAIGAEFLRRKHQSITTLFIVGSVVAAIIVAILVSLVSWWWSLLAVVLLIGFLICATMLTVARILIRSLGPRITKEQKKVVSDFVDKFERVSDQLGTPWFIIAFRVMRDVIWPSRNGSYIQSVAHDGTTLHTDYLEVARAFKA